jgi:hypothetical protein
VKCPPGEIACTGTVIVRTLNAVAAGTTRRQARKQILTLASGTFTVAGGKTVTFQLHLSENGRRLFSGLHLLRALATVVTHHAAGSEHATQTIVTIRSAEAKRKS